MSDLTSGWTCEERRPEKCRDPFGCHCREITALKHGSAALSAKLAEALEALKPFGEVLNDHDPEDEDDHTPGTLVVGSVTYYELDLGDFRRAAALTTPPAPLALSRREEG